MTCKTASKRSMLVLSLLFFAAGIFGMFFPSSELLAQTVEDTLDLIKEASEFHLSSIASGYGEGKVSTELKIAPGATPPMNVDVSQGKEVSRTPFKPEELVNHASLKIYFSGEQTRLDLDEMFWFGGKTPQDSLISIADNEKVVRYSPPVGGGTGGVSIYGTTPTRKADEIAGASMDIGFEWRRLTRTVQELAKTIGRWKGEGRAITITEEKVDGRRLWRLDFAPHSDVGNTAIKYWVDPESDLVPVKKEVWRGDGQLAARVEMEWAKDDNIWFIKKINYLTNSFEEGRLGRTSTKSVIFDEFQPNSPVSDDTFTLAGLNLPQGTPISDNRFSPPLKTQWGVPPLSEKHVEEIIEEAKEMLAGAPTAPVSQDVTGVEPGTAATSPERPSGIQGTLLARTSQYREILYLVAAVTAIILAFLIILLLRRRAKAKRQTGSSP